jgi:outer membrane protein
MRLLLIAVLCLPFAAHADDLLDVLRLARSADPQLAIARAQQRVAQEGVVQARAPLLPQASATLQFNQTRVPGSDDNRARGAGASLTQTVLDWSALQRLRAAQSSAMAQDASTRAAEQALLMRVATAYFNVLGARETLANVQANEDALHQQVEQAQARHRQGLSALVDVEQARAYHAGAQAQTIAARQALEDARDALAEITGRAPGALKGLRDELPAQAPQPASPAAWIENALALNPSLQALREAVDASDKRVEAARAGHLPTLAAGVDVGRASAWPASAANDSRSVTTVGLTLTVPLFAGGAQQSQLRQALAQRDIAREALETQQRRVVHDVQSQYRAVLAGIEQVRVARAGVESADKALAATRVGQGVGTQTMTDLLLAIQTLSSARDAFALARHQLVLSRLQLAQAAGGLAEPDLAAVNGLLE